MKTAFFGIAVACVLAVGCAVPEVEVTDLESSEVVAAAHVTDVTWHYRKAMGWGSILEEAKIPGKVTVKLVGNELPLAKSPFFKTEATAQAAVVTITAPKVKNYRVTETRQFYVRFAVTRDAGGGKTYATEPYRGFAIIDASLPGAKEKFASSYDPETQTISGGNALSTGAITFKADEAGRLTPAKPFYIGSGPQLVDFVHFTQTIEIVD